MTDEELKKLAEEWSNNMHERHEGSWNCDYSCPEGGSYEEFWICEKCESPIAGFIAGFNQGRSYYIDKRCQEKIRLMKNNKAIKRIYIFDNGMCAVFDEDEKQMPELQGVYEEKKSLIRLHLESQDFLPEIKRQ